MFRELLDERLKDHERSAGYLADAARRRSDVVGKPAADWTFPDLADKKLALADLRGKVVVLDFWYRGCGWCVKAMPQMNAVAESFAGRPVAVLGMNTDADVEDARLVVEVMGLKYPTLRVDREFPEKYGVRGFPTVIVVDPEGRVSDIHVGYSKDLREKLTKSIEAALPR
jgi:thiol-disulfide isomerase/thioredoxin